jgi:broad specificity phosphatase PhoE
MNCRIDSLDFGALSHLPGVIVVGRHGQTVSNLNGRIMGGTDSPLTLDGIQKVRDLSLMLKGFGIGEIFSSPLGRAALTSSIYSEVLMCPIHFRASLSELSGGHWEGLYRNAVRGEVLTLRSTWIERPPNGESYNDAESRVMSFIYEIGSRNSNQNLLVIGHAGINRVLLKMILGLESATAIKISFPHEVMYTITSGQEIRHLTSAGSSGRGLLFERD